MMSIIYLLCTVGCCFKQSCYTIFLFTDSIEEVQKHCKDHKSQLELEKKELQEVCLCVRIVLYVCMFTHTCDCGRKTYKIHKYIQIQALQEYIHMHGSVFY